MDKKFAIVLCILFLILGFSISKMFDNQKLPSFKNIPETEQDIIDDCKNLSIFVASKCIQDNIKTFYIYRENPDYNELTFDELKKNGGDCRDWALLITDLGKELEFNAKSFVIEIKDGYNHRFTVLSNEDGWCIFNNIDYKCYKVKNEI